MGTIKRISGDYGIVSVGASDNVSVTTHTLTVSGNLTVSGTTTTINSTETEIKDRMLVLNQGETAAGVTGTYSGITVDRGSATDVAIRWNETADKWEITNDGSTYNEILAASGSGADVINDTSPQLGGNLDVNGRSIVSASNGDIIVAPNGSGITQIDSIVKLANQSDPSATASYNKLYAKEPSAGGTGLFFKNSTTGDELVSKSKAIVYGIIF